MTIPQKKSDRINAFSLLQSFLASILEKSCGFNSSYARSIFNIHDDFTVAFLKNNNTVGHVPVMENFQSQLVQKSVI